MIAPEQGRRPHGDYRREGFLEAEILAAERLRGGHVGVAAFLAKSATAVLFVFEEPSRASAGRGRRFRLKPLRLDLAGARRWTLVWSQAQ